LQNVETEKHYDSTRDLNGIIHVLQVTQTANHQEIRTQPIQPKTAHG
jgi:hypothetical protein